MQGSRHEPPPIMVGASDAIDRIRRRTEQLSRSPLPILVAGETGVGKLHLARMLHHASGGSPSGLRLIDCRAFAATSLTMKDLLQAEHHGSGDITVVFKNIEALPEASQAELVLWLNDRSFAGLDRVGYPRIISTTTHDVQQLLESGRLCADLSYCVAAVSVAIPPLRLRMEDIEPLARHFISMISTNGGSKPSLDWALPELMGKHWPGNVRELRNTVYCLCLGLHDLSESSRPRRMSLADQMCLFERTLLRRYLEECIGNVAKMSDALSVPKTTLYEKLNRLSLDPDLFKAIRHRSNGAAAIEVTGPHASN